MSNNLPVSLRKLKELILYSTHKFFGNALCDVNKLMEIWIFSNDFPKAISQRMGFQINMFFREISRLTKQFLRKGVLIFRLCSSENMQNC